MANEFVAKNGLISQNNSTVSGSLTVITGSSIELQVTNTGVRIGNIITDNHNITGSLNLSGSSAIIGALAVGTSSLGSTENTLVVGLPPAGGTGEGGQILLQASGGLYTSASMIDNYQNRFRILKGTNASSTAEYFNINLHTGQAGLSTYTSATSFTGTPKAALVTDTSGNVLTTTFEFPNSQTYTGTIIFTTGSGGSAPSGATNHTYNWTRTGNLVTLKISLVYASAGSLVTAAQMALPNDAPTPFVPAGYSAASALDVLYYGTGQISTTTNTSPAILFRAYLRVNGSANGYELIVTTTTSQSARVANMTVQYFTS